MSQFWSPEDCSRMAEMVAAKATYAEYLAAFPFRSYEALKLKARQMGLRLSTVCACGRVASIKDRLCPICRNAHSLAAHRDRVRYPWLPEWDAEILRLNNSRSRNEWTATLRHVSALSKVPISTVKTHCARLNVYWFRRAESSRPWTAEEDAILGELAGSKTVKHISTALKRTASAISCRIHTNGLSQRLTDGYTQQDLVAVFGVSVHLVKKWINKGWLGPQTDWHSQHYRAPEELVEEFIRTHPEQYDLRKVDDAWFKGMIFPKFGISHRVQPTSLRSATQ